MRYRKRPVEIEAEQFNFRDSKGVERVVEWVRSGGGVIQVEKGDNGVRGAYLSTLEGPQIISNSDWIIKGIAGEFYPCKDFIFRETYDLVEGV